MPFCRLLIFFKINFFENFFQEYHTSVKQIGSILSGLIWVQSVCKGYQQTALFVIFNKNMPSTRDLFYFEEIKKNVAGIKLPLIRGFVLIKQNCSNVLLHLHAG